MPKAQTFSEIAKARGLSPGSKPDDAKALTVEFVKADAERRLVWGWASIVTKGGEPVVDTQGDQITPEDLEVAAHNYVRTSRVSKRQHAGPPTAEFVEGIVFTKAKQEALGIDLGREGWFAGFYVHDDKTWEAAKAGKLPGFSIGGRGVRIPLKD